ncbi:hypothetical protein [Pseudomonas pseudonitroreducens]|uniref:hypothetical protein n=1 Tax=Pseudomonas pseudonitroreducens TaxID=2892326 RepID=UPI001F47EB80|nr:hypothetical protein [Pseudomonas pseudonitroreducens]
MKKFLLDNWQSKLLDHYTKFMNLHELINNSEALAAHRNSLEYFAIEPSLHEEGTEENLRNSIVNDIQGLTTHFASQTLVGMCTTLEVAMKDFFHSVFFTHPKFMTNYVGEEKNKGMIKFSEITSAKSLESLMYDQAEKSAGIASRGKYSKCLLQAGQLCDSPFNDDLISRIAEIQDIRNEVIHENALAELTLENISEIHGTISNAIEGLGRIARSKGVEGNYTWLEGDYIELLSFALVSPKT